MKTAETNNGSETLLPHLVSTAASAITATLAARLLGRSRSGSRRRKPKATGAPRSRQTVPARKGGVRHG